MRRTFAAGTAAPDHLDNNLAPTYLLIIEFVLFKKFQTAISSVVDIFTLFAKRSRIDEVML